MGRILKDIYSDIRIASLLGFKGGTCAYFFYDLPRFSVVLDFDLISFPNNDEVKKEIYEKILKPEVLDKNIRPLAAHEAGNDDWRYLSAALLFK